jgi:hypothetical protein
LKQKGAGVKRVVEGKSAEDAAQDHQQDSFPDISLTEINLMFSEMSRNSFLNH